jgi:hypothetical protein
MSFFGQISQIMLATDPAPSDACPETTTSSLSASLTAAHKQDLMRMKDSGSTSITVANKQGSGRARHSWRAFVTTRAALSGRGPRVAQAAVTVQTSELEA